MGIAHTDSSLLILEEVKKGLVKKGWYEDPRYAGVLVMKFSRACQGLTPPLGRDLKLSEIRVDGPYRIMTGKVVVCWDVEFTVSGDSRQNGEARLTDWNFKIQVRMPLKVMQEMGQEPKAEQWEDLCWDCGEAMIHCRCPSAA